MKFLLLFQYFFLARIVALNCSLYESAVSKNILVFFWSWLP